MTWIFLIGGELNPSH